VATPALVASVVTPERVPLLRVMGMLTLPAVNGAPLSSRVTAAPKPWSTVTFDGGLVVKLTE
jgi:hypothetical protein